MNTVMMRVGFTLTYLTGMLIAAPQITKDEGNTTKQHRCAEWTIVCYIQADNNLAPFAEYNIQDMEKIGSNDKVNMLVQWDQPENHKTWRYRIEKGKRVDAGSLDIEMGIDPETELVDMMKWAAEAYPAKHYMMILWNHGSGVEDLKKRTMSCPVLGWIQPVAGSCLTIDEKLLSDKDRGILYDDSEGTLLTNEGLQNVCKAVKSDLGKNIDVVGCDACLMAMIEVAYNMRGCVDYFVASQELEPGEGWPYSGLLKPVVDNPSLTPEELSNTVVTAYGEFYKEDAMCTQSAMRMSDLDAVCSTLDNVIEECLRYLDTHPLEARILMLRARYSATQFDNKDFIDLYSFYEGLREGVFFLRMNQGSSESSESADAEYIGLDGAIERAQGALRKAITSYVTGDLHPEAKGLSIYYPRGLFIDSKYKKVAFALETKWLQFLRSFDKI